MLDAAVEFLPVRKIDYYIYSEFRTTVGVIHREEDHSTAFWNIASNQPVKPPISNALIIGQPESITLLQNMPSNHAIEVRWPAYSSPKKLQRRMMSYLCDVHSKRVSYTGANNQKYSKNCRPKAKEIDIKSERDFYVPVWTLNWKCNSSNTYTIKFVENFQKIYLMEGELSGTYCLECKKIAKSTKTCATCEKRICSACSTCPACSKASFLDNLPVAIDLVSWINKGLAHFQAGKLKEAEEAFQTVLQQNSSDARAWTGFGLVLFQQKNRNSAKKAFQNAIENDPNNCTAWLCLGYLLHGEGRIKRAENAFRVAIQNDSENMRAWSELAASLFSEGPLDEAEMLYRQLANERDRVSSARGQLELPQTQKDYIRLLNELYEQFERGEVSEEEYMIYYNNYHEKYGVGV
ncbi:MAG: tetratricopeptide repeat protein [Candidatus Heimdallarchaeota archaeon]